MKPKDIEMIYKMTFGKMGANLERVGELVRCKECKHLLKNDRIAPNWWRICDYWRTGVDENEYCARGERKEE